MLLGFPNNNGITISTPLTLLLINESDPESKFRFKLMGFPLGLPDPDEVTSPLPIVSSRKERPSRR